MLAIIIENLEGNILRLKLIQVFQTGSKDEIDNTINSNAHYIKLSKAQGPLGPTDLHVLHIAVQAAPLDVIRHLITKYNDAPAFDINSTEPHTGNTPLHVAAIYGRSDIVMYLLSFEDSINDTILNYQMKQAVEVARTSELAEAMLVVKSQYVAKVSAKMKEYFHTCNIPALETLFSNPRVTALLDINGQDPNTGFNFLHDSVRNGNIPMIQFILDHGGDPLKRNSKGVLPIDLTKNDTIRKMLKKSTKSQQVIVQPNAISPLMNSQAQLSATTSLDSSHPHGFSEDGSEHPSLVGSPPVMKGFLKKWTNFTSRYKLRWFVLENNVLSYYKRQGDTERACRGSINMKQARLHVDSTEKLGFEVLSSTSVKFHLKANHPVETTRWVWALTNAIQYAKDEEKVKNLANSHQRYQSNGSNIIKTTSIDYNLSRNEGLTSPTISNSTAGSFALGHGISKSVSSSYPIPVASRPQSVLVGENGINNSVAKLVQMNNSEIERRGNFDRDDDDDDDEDDESEEYANRDDPPFTSEINSAEDSIGIGLKSIELVLASLSSSLSNNLLPPEELKKGLSSLEQAVELISTHVSEYTSHVAKREKFYQDKLERSNQLQELWASTIRDMEIEKEKMQSQLHAAIQKKRQANKVLREVAETSIAGSTRTSVVYPLTRGKSIVIGTHNISRNQESSEPGQSASVDKNLLDSSAALPIDINALEKGLKRVDIESESESELEDEFFDALGSGEEEFVEEPQPPNVFSNYKMKTHSNSILYRLPQPSHSAPPPPVQPSYSAPPPPVQPSYSAPPPPPPQSDISENTQKTVSHPYSSLSNDSKLSIDRDGVSQTINNLAQSSYDSAPSQANPLVMVPLEDSNVVPRENDLVMEQEQKIPFAFSGPDPEADLQYPLPTRIPTEPGNGIPADLKSYEAPSVDSPGTAASSVLEKEVQADLTEAQRQKLNTIVVDNSFAGYEDGPRKRLALDDDDRPSISLWGVLKNLIGKDMTRMTLPVSFNECTNLLQRSAEDMEYTDLLDKAASITEDPGERMAYVAAFAASSYSSTIGRVAKPFNPLLGETFEYARPDMGYRMFSEQVSHHPPVGAMIAESPRWDFYGASNVKSKFTGRSFDINPLGLWYIKLRPNKDAGVEEESYSFRKVTSTVVGIITGNPVVDQYGDMEITNYTLGYKCLLKFKARGWLSDSAYEVRGTVYNKEGIPQWIVGGRWNDKIFGKRLHSEEVKEIKKGKAGDLGEKSNRVLLWRVHDRPKAPFNLTPFAITLNDLPKRLSSWLPRSDTRFRPDQRAMEEGRYDAASNEKHRVEEKQRAKRREREARNEEYSPRWFEKKIHPLSGQEYWAYKGDYWEERMDHDWKQVPDIF